MKVILQRSVERLGDPGDVADVADGYARNYLIPRGLAVRAEKGAVRHAESLKRAHEVRTSAQKGEFETLAARLIQTTVVVTARVGEEGKLFGSVTAADVAEALSAQAGVSVDRRDVHLAEPIRSVGAHEVAVRLHPEVEPVVTVDVQPQE
ncbi:MAG: 50S ribosomal protein L9 [Actinomycetota bacterium]